MSTSTNHIIQKLITITFITLFLHNSPASDCSDAFGEKSPSNITQKSSFSKKLFLEEILSITKEMQLTLYRTVNILKGEKLQLTDNTHSLIHLYPEDKIEKINDVIKALKEEVVKIETISSQISDSIYEAIDIDSPLKTHIAHPIQTALLEKVSYDLSNILDFDLIRKFDLIIEENTELEKFVTEVREIYDNNNLNTLAQKLDQEIEQQHDDYIKSDPKTHTLKKANIKTFTHQQSTQEGFFELEVLDDVLHIMKQRQSVIHHTLSLFKNSRLETAQIIKGHILNSLFSTEDTDNNSNIIYLDPSQKKDTTFYANQVQQIDKVTLALKNEDTKIENIIEIFNNTKYEAIATNLQTKTEALEKVKLTRLEEMRNTILLITLDFHITDKINMTLNKIPELKENVINLFEIYDNTDLNTLAEILNKEIEEHTKIETQEALNKAVSKNLTSSETQKKNSDNTIPFRSHPIHSIHSKNINTLLQNKDNVIYFLTAATQLKSTKGSFTHPPRVVQQRFHKTPYPLQNQKEDYNNVVLFPSTHTSLPPNKTHPIFTYIVKGQFQKVETLLKAGLDPNTRAKDLENISVFHALALSRNEKGSIKLLPKFIELGFDINAQDSHGNTGLIAAIAEGKYLLAQAFLQYKQTNIYLQNQDGFNILHFFSMANLTNPDAIQALNMVFSQGGAILINLKNIRGQTSLHHAAGYSNIELLNILTHMPEAHVNITTHISGAVPILIPLTSVAQALYDILHPEQNVTPNPLKIHKDIQAIQILLNSPHPIDLTIKNNSNISPNDKLLFLKEHLLQMPEDSPYYSVFEPLKEAFSSNKYLNYQQ